MSTKGQVIKVRERAQAQGELAGKDGQLVPEMRMTDTRACLLQAEQLILYTLDIAVQGSRRLGSREA